jgi:hypothetical protein
MEPDEYARQKQLFLDKMTKTADEIKAFERNTVLVRIKIVNRRKVKITHGKRLNVAPGQSVSTSDITENLCSRPSSMPDDILKWCVQICQFFWQFL